MPMKTLLTKITLSWTMEFIFLEMRILKISAHTELSFCKN